jgi:hypothetical protein
MGSKTTSLAVLLLLSSACFAFPASAHEQKTMTVILLADGVASGNITDPSFVQGNALWFKMEDNTNNTTMEVRLDIDRDGTYNPSSDFTSPTLTESCELDENGSLEDETCAVSTTYVFAANATVGAYTFWIERTSDGNAVVYEHTVMLHEDVHVEETDGPSPGDCFGLGCNESENTADSATEKGSEASEDPLLLGLALVALVGILATANSIRNERRSSKKDDVWLQEEA